ncbi:Uma2 family endonuclease [Leptolyngbya cf. ectocarpi LEGE 11479]|uniref:Uma2 family endonuclease n=1 Tax=Leptolyngbya cf. ectocarpi LEGE 11479 TaxID=1828722 RepID=A0A928ZYZ4_LEPEC|nr:Uma2 family endonuclease [Leptolyngbya ectocarpi]MBE9070032.1 Uma2 family endonuclease [Leptolyngbya cf. ectocarpi LEGE 11479]
MTQALSRKSLLNEQPTDQQIIYSGISWPQFQLIRSGFADSPGIRLAYYDNTIEILMPGREHEMFSRLIGFLIGLFCLEKGIEFEPTGSMTHEREGEASAQADESYCFGSSKATPDLVIEVVFTSGGLSKLSRYRALGILEVWFWQDGLFSLYRLKEGDYVEITRSEIPELAALDMDVLTRCVLMGKTSRLDTANEFREAVRL